MSEGNAQPCEPPPQPQLRQNLFWFNSTEKKIKTSESPDSKYEKELAAFSWLHLKRQMGNLVLFEISTSG